MTFHFPLKALEQHSAILGKAGSGKTVTAKGIAEMLLDRGERIAVVDPTGVWWGMKSTADGKQGAYPIVIFGGEHADFPITERHGEAIAEIIGTTTTPVIVDTALMRVGERTRFFADFANALLRKNKGPLHLFIDEAHLFAPQGRVADPQSANMLHAANNLVSLGRARGLRITMITQRPAKLHKDSLTQVETLVAMRLLAPQDRRAIEEWIADQADIKQGKEIIASLPTLKTGNGWVWAPEIGILEKVKFPMIKTFDSSKAPSAGSHDKNIKLAPINLDDMQDRLKIFEEETKSNDPSALKKRIKELEKSAVTVGRMATPEEQETYRNRGYEIGYKDGYAKGMEHGYSKGWGISMQMISKVEMPIYRHGMEYVGPKPMKLEPLNPEKYGRSKAAEALPLIKEVNHAIKMSNPQIKIMQSLQFWESVGIKNPLREQVAGVAGYSPGSGGFNNLIGGMGKNGLICIPSPGRLSLARECDIETLSTAQAAAKMLSFLSNPQQKIVNCFDSDLCDLSRVEVARRCGYSEGSGGFNNLIGSLSSLKILEKPRPGFIELSDWVKILVRDQ